MHTRRGVVAALGNGPASGQRLAQGLGVSRAAVHKAVETLRSHGFVIGAVPGRGYELQRVPDQPWPEVVQPLLPPGSLGEAGWVYVPQCGSTNVEAVALARTGAPHGMVVVAEQQGAGRGRRGRVFESPPGGLYLSVVLRPPLPPQQAFRLTLCGALAVQRAVAAHGVAALVKWPNDVMVAGRKLSGVLTELSADAERIQHAVVGVGVNADTRADQFPEALRGVATSLRMETGQPVPRVGLLVDVLAQMTAWYRQSLGNFPAVIEAARRCSHTLGQKIRVTDGDAVVEGEAVDLDDEGALLVRTAHGVRRIFSGDVEPV